MVLFPMEQIYVQGAQFCDIYIVIKHVEKM